MASFEDVPFESLPLPAELVAGFFGPVAASSSGSAGGVVEAGGVAPFGSVSGAPFAPASSAFSSSAAVPSYTMAV